MGSHLRMYSQVVSPLLILLILICVVKGFSTSDGSSPNTMPHCLNSSSTEKPFELSKHPECTSDRANISNYREVKETEEMFGLKPAEITFIGCGAAPFSTSMVELDPPFHFQILYEAGDDSTSEDEYIAPILHELGHVYQFKKAGSPSKLFELSTERLELGADFLAGFAAAHLGFKNPSLFERTLSLVGSYEVKSDSHSTPEGRTQAFRYGFHCRRSAPVESVYSDFQDNLFSQIKHSEEIPQ
jgi:hypothetical protein